MEDFKNEGIYAIVNIITNDKYIGSSMNLGSRRDKHFSLLRHNKHSNHRLQRDVNKYGIDTFKFSVLEFRTENLKEKEQCYMDTLLPTYNITTEVIRNTPSESSREKMSITRLQMYKDGFRPNCAKDVVSVNIATGEITEYKSIMKASVATGTHRTSIQRVLYGKYAQMKGFKWYYKDKFQDLIKSDKLLGDPEEDNQQPMQNLNGSVGFND